MGAVGVRELKNRLTYYLQRARKGEEVIVTERGRPVAVLRSLQHPDRTSALATRLARLAALPITVDDQTGTRAWSDTIVLARAHGLSAYDAAYLELAVREGLPIATLDDRLKAAAKAVGVPYYKP